VLAAGATLYLASLNEVSSPRDTAVVCVLILAFSTVGALISSRRPENAIGWLFCSGSLMWIIGELALEYGVYALISRPGTLPAGAWMVWFGGWVRALGWLEIISFLLLLFPNGRLPSWRWRPVAWLLVLYLAFFTVAFWLSPHSSDLRLMFVDNPTGLDVALPDILEFVYLTLPLPLLLGGAAVVTRYRGSVGEERQQIKWFTYAVGIMVVVFVPWFALVLAGLAVGTALTFTLPMLGLPIAVGVAILRHRLYDIDVVINRTLVYASLTAVLVGLYLGGVVLLQYVFRGFSGNDSQLAVVASTLTIAALFNPLRRGIQRFIDRRFYRDKYDARRTLEAFGARLRNETDLEALSGELLAVVRDTVAPAHATVWLRESGERR
jgi:hypothetical protein